MSGAESLSDSSGSIASCSSAALSFNRRLELANPELGSDVDDGKIQIEIFLVRYIIYVFFAFFSASEQEDAALDWGEPGVPNPARLLHTDHGGDWVTYDVGGINQLLLGKIGSWVKQPFNFLLDTTPVDCFMQLERGHASPTWTLRSLREDGVRVKWRDD